MALRLAVQMLNDGLECDNGRTEWAAPLLLSMCGWCGWTPPRTGDYPGNPENGLRLGSGLQLYASGE